MAYSNVASINQTLRRAKAEGFEISETALRRWVKEGTLHATFAGRKALIYWPSLMNLLCGETTPPISTEATESGSVQSAM